MSARLTEAQRRVLEALRPLPEERGARAWSDVWVIAEQTGMYGPAVGNVCLHLRRLGFVEDLFPSRKRLVRITPAGLAALASEGAQDSGRGEADV